MRWRTGNRQTWLELAFLAAGIYFIFRFQFALPQMFDADSYLHIRMAEFLRQRGLEQTFPWARYTAFCANFSDKDFLFHVILLPFTFCRNIFWGGKLAAALLFSGLYVSFYYCLRQWGERKLIPLLLTAFFFCPPFLLNLSCARPYPLVIFFSFLAILFAVNRRPGALFVLTLVYSLTHVSAPYMLIFLFLVEASRFLSERKICVKNIWGVAAGIVLGMFIHPYFPNNVEIFVQNGIMVPLYAMRTGVIELGAEFFPLNTRDCLFRLAVAWAGFLGVIGYCVYSPHKIRLSPVSRALLAVSLFFIVMGFISQRSFNHGWPLFLLFFAAWLKDVGRSVPAPGRLLPVICVAGALLLVGYGGYMQSEMSEAVRAFSAVNGHYESMAEFMRSAVPPGEVIFTANWSDPQYFIGLNPGNYYYVTLDPVYMYSFDRRRYELYRAIAAGRCAEPYRALREVFHTRYGYIGKNYFSGMLDQIRADQRFVIMREDDQGAFFRLQEPGAAQ